MNAAVVAAAVVAVAAVVYLSGACCSVIYPARYVRTCLVSVVLSSTQRDSTTPGTVVVGVAICAVCVRRYPGGPTKPLGKTGKLHS